MKKTFASVFFISLLSNHAWAENDVYPGIGLTTNTCKFTTLDVVIDGKTLHSNVKDQIIKIAEKRNDCNFKKNPKVKFAREVVYSEKERLKYIEVKY